MPISCPGGGKARYRYADNGARLAFCGSRGSGKGEVVEVKTPRGELRRPTKRRHERRVTR